MCKALSLSVSGPGALCVGPRRSQCVGARQSVCRARALSRRPLCRTPALSRALSGPRRSVCRALALSPRSSALSVLAGTRPQLRSATLHLVHPSSESTCHPSVPNPHPAERADPPAPIYLPANHPGRGPPSSDPRATHPARRVDFFQETTPNITVWGLKIKIIAVDACPPNSSICLVTS